MLTVKGHGVLTIGNTEIPFENRVNTNFLMAAMNLIDIQNMGGGSYESHGLMDLPCTGFQICSDTVDPYMNRIYNRLAFAAIDNFTPSIQKPLKVVLQGAGQFDTSGTARSAGFNLVTGASVGIPYVNVPRRQARVRVAGVESLPYSNNWVYNPILKAFYRYELTNSEIWKLPFDIDTGEFGSEATMLTDQFTPPTNNNYRWIVTDGVKRLFKFKDNNRDALHVYDLEAEQLTEILLSEVALNSGGVNDKGWDEAAQRIVMNYGSEYYSIDPDTGIVEILPFIGEKTSFSNLFTIKEHFMMERNAIRRPYEDTNLALSHTGTSAGFFTSYYDKAYRFPDESGWMITGTFDSLTSPASCSLYMAKEPDMGFSMISIPPTEVEIDTPFSVEYTLEVVDNR